MGTRRFDTTMSFGRARAKAKIQCAACHHGRLVDQADLMRMFPTPLPIDDARRRLRCTRCRARRATITPIPEVGR